MFWLPGGPPRHPPYFYHIGDNTPAEGRHATALFSFPVQTQRKPTKKTVGQVLLSPVRPDLPAECSSVAGQGMVLDPIVAERPLEQAAGVLRGYLEFKEPGCGSNPSRWPVASWRDAFLAHAEKARILGIR
jgi:hypothetical protein